MAFSVPENIPPPPSLKNIFKELAIDIPGFDRGDPNSSSLEKWAQRGVFLLNTVLTVEYVIKDLMSKYSISCIPISNQ